MRLTHSFSSLKQFDNCPKRYYHQRIAKDAVDPGSEASKYGERVHKHLEERLRDKTPLPVESSKHEEICKQLESLSTDLRPEIKLTITKDFKPTTWFAPDAWFRSQVDLLAMVPPEGAVIVDFKTGTRRPDFLQLEMSAMQAFLHYPELEKAITSFVWLKDRTLDKELYRRDDLEDMQENLMSKVERIEEAADLGIWPAKPGPLCRYCPVYDRCEYALKRRY